MGIEYSQSIRHTVQEQSYKIDLEYKIIHNPGNKKLRKADVEKEYQGTVKLSIADKGFAMTSMLEEDEDFHDMMNRLTKLAIFKLTDSLFPSKRTVEMKFMKPKKK